MSESAICNLEPEVPVKRVVSSAAPIAVLLLATASWLGAADGRCIQQTRYWGGDGPAQHLVVVNDHAFFGGTTLRVADLGDPTDPTVVHELRLDAPTAGLASRGDRIYAVTGGGELTVIDATDPDRAAVIARQVPDDPYWQLDLIDIHGDLAVVGGRGTWSNPATTTKLTFLDVSGSDPEPEPVGSLELEGVVESLALGDGVAVAATRSGPIWFIDVSDPAAPVVALEMDGADFLVSGQIRGLAARDDLLGISDSEGRVVLVDISDPSEPDYQWLIQGLGIGIPTLTFEGSMLHATGSACTQFGKCGGYALIELRGAAAPPIVLGSFEGSALSQPVAYHVFVVAAAFKAGLRVVDLNVLTSPVLLDVVLPVREAGVVASAGRLVHVVDVTSLADPVDPKRNTLEILRRPPIGDLEETASYGPAGVIWALAADGDYVAAAIYNDVTEFHSVEVIDASDPEAPVIGTRLGARVSQDFETLDTHLVVQDDRLLLSLADTDRIFIYELSEGGRATQVGTYIPGAELVNFAVPSRDLMAVAVRNGDTGWIEVVDTRVPSSTVLASVFELPPPGGVPLTVEAEGNRIAVLVRDFGSFIGPYTFSILIDATDPTHPALAMDGLPGGEWIALGGGLLHSIGDTYPPSGVRHTVIDVTHPPDVDEAENLGFLDVLRNRVDADGRYFCVSRYRLESYLYGDCNAPQVGRPAIALVD